MKARVNKNIVNLGDKPFVSNKSITFTGTQFFSLVTTVFNYITPLTDKGYDLERFVIRFGDPSCFGNKASEVDVGYLGD